ncbi:MAG: CBS domain-containing protein [Desulfobacterales bacterium]|nr:CBS domain-containing protein [Desulfobacterales bacterium]
MEAAIAPLADFTAGSIMSTPPVCIEEEAPLTDAVDRMLTKKVKRLPVTGKGGVLAGVLSRLDIFQIITRQAPDWDAAAKRDVILGNPLFVSDIMTRETHAVNPGASVEEVIRMIDSDDIQRVAVVEKDGRFLGLISDRDLLAAFSMHRAGIWEYFSRKIPFTEKGRKHKGLRKKLREKTAADVMITDLITVAEETGVDEAISLMVEKCLKRLPVIDSKGGFSGMISRDALLRAGFRAST